MTAGPGRTRVKICGITDEADLDLAVDAGADAIGLIASVPVETPREIAPAAASALAARTPPFVTSVLVTMPADATAALELLDAVRPDAVQVHGSIGPDEVAEIAKAARVIRALDVEDGAGMRAVEGVVDAILIDSTDDRGAGGTGHTHDWELARSRVRSLEVPVILAGGLQAANVSRAIEQVRPYAVDVASGVEGADGKDPEAVRAFVARAHATEVG